MIEGGLRGGVGGVGSFKSGALGWDIERPPGCGRRVFVIPGRCKIIVDGKWLGWWIVDDGKAEWCGARL